jgi:hypothetical protein
MTEKKHFLLCAMIVLGSAIHSVGCSENLTPNVVLLLVDTLRADHVHGYGYVRGTTPHLDRFAEDNLLFTNVRSQSSCTFPSMNAMLTSKYPFRFYGQSDRKIGIPVEVG